MERLIASRSFPATPTQLANVRDFARSAYSVGAEHLPLLLTELATLLIQSSSWLTIRLIERNDDLQVEVRIDPSAGQRSVHPEGLARRVIESMTDELRIDLDAFTVSVHTPIHHPSYTG